MIETEIRLFRVEISAWPLDDIKEADFGTKLSISTRRMDKSNAVFLSAHLVAKDEASFAQMAAGLVALHDGDLDEDEKLLKWAGGDAAGQLYDVMSTHIRSQAPHYKIEFDLPSKVPSPKVSLDEPLLADEDDDVDVEASEKDPAS